MSKPSGMTMKDKIQMTVMQQPSKEEYVVASMALAAAAVLELVGHALLGCNGLQCSFMLWSALVLLVIAAVKR